GRAGLGAPRALRRAGRRGAHALGPLRRGPRALPRLIPPAAEHAPSRREAVARTGRANPPHPSRGEGRGRRLCLMSPMPTVSYSITIRLEFAARSAAVSDITARRAHRGAPGPAHGVPASG